MPVVTASWSGFVPFLALMLVFLGQELLHGRGAPAAANDRDERWALVYLTWLPVALMSLSFVCSLQGWWDLPARHLTYAVGLALLAGGLLGRSWTHATLGRFHQGRVTIHDDHVLVVDGPYRVLRHPMYAASALACLGAGLAMGTWPGLGLTFVGTLPGMLRRIHVEERALADALGSDYRRYAADRRRLVPGIW